MKNITINIHSDIVFKALQHLKDIGHIPSVSEAVRSCVRDYLIKELEYMALLSNLDNFSALAETIKMEREKELIEEIHTRKKGKLGNIYHPNEIHTNETYWRAE